MVLIYSFVSVFALVNSLFDSRLGVGCWPICWLGFSFPSCLCLDVVYLRVIVLCNAFCRLTLALGLDDYLVLPGAATLLCCGLTVLLIRVFTYC